MLSCISILILCNLCIFSVISPLFVECSLMYFYFYFMQSVYFLSDFSSFVECSLMYFYFYFMQSVYFLSDFSSFVECSLMYFYFMQSVYFLSDFSSFVECSHVFLFYAICVFSQWFLLFCWMLSHVFLFLFYAICVFSQWFLLFCWMLSCISIFILCNLCIFSVISPLLSNALSCISILILCNLCIFSVMSPLLLYLVMFSHTHSWPAWDRPRRVGSRLCPRYRSSSTSSWSCWRTARSRRCRWSCGNTRSSSYLWNRDPWMSSRSCDPVLIARRAALTHAVVSSVHLHVLGRTDTGVVSQRVVAGSRTADADVCRAFINIWENPSENTSAFKHSIDSFCLAAPLIDACRNLHVFITIITINNTFSIIIQ